MSSATYIMLIAYFLLILINPLTSTPPPTKKPTVLSSTPSTPSPTPAPIPLPPGTPTNKPTYKPTAISVATPDPSTEPTAQTPTLKPTGAPTLRPTSAPTSSCGYVPPTCVTDISWALNEGRYSKPEWYPRFLIVTGRTLFSATDDDMIAYWVCTNTGNTPQSCYGLTLPCFRKCYPQTYFPTLAPTTIPTLPQQTTNMTKDSNFFQKPKPNNETNWIWGIVIGLSVLLLCSCSMIVVILYFMRSNQRKVIKKLAQIQKDSDGVEKMEPNSTNDVKMDANELKKLASVNSVGSIGQIEGCEREPIVTEYL